MTGNDAKLASARAIETYGNVMLGKGLKARAEWAYEQARKIRQDVVAAMTFETRLAA